jgi:hypothetical protein
MLSAAAELVVDRQKEWLRRCASRLQSSSAESAGCTGSRTRTPSPGHRHRPGAGVVRPHRRQGRARHRRQGAAQPWWQPGHELGCLP